MENAVQIKNLTKEYKDFSLKQITMNIPKGCVMGLIGANGAGKSTLIQSILGLLKADYDEIFILGKDLKTQEREIKEDIAVIFDVSHYNLQYTPAFIGKILSGVYKNWDMGLYTQYLKRFDLPKDKKIKKFSKGMKMKYALTLALAHNAELLIMDEPTSGLDPLSRSQLLNVLNDYMENGGKGVLFSTHITSDLDKIADMLIMIHNGRIVFQEEKDFLLDNYRIIKGDKKLLTENIRQLFLNITETAFGFTGVTRHAARVQSYLPDAITERPTIEDIMLANLGGCGK